MAATENLLQCYSILKLSTDSSWQEVKAAWRALSRRTHPDTKVPGSAAQKHAEEEQKELNRAYDHLKNYYKDRKRENRTGKKEDRTAKPYDGSAGTGFGEFVRKTKERTAHSFSSEFLDNEYQRAINLEKSRDGKPDLLEAAGIYRRIGLLGYTKAQFRLGLLHFDGDMKDLSQAAYWWALAAEGGHLSAQFNLGILYENGWGVNKNIAKAMHWFSCAANSGDPQARTILSNRAPVQSSTKCTREQLGRMFLGKTGRIKIRTV